MYFKHSRYLALLWFPTQIGKMAGSSTHRVIFGFFSLVFSCQPNPSSAERNDSICATYVGVNMSTYVNKVGYCAGEVHLSGTYLKVGIHEAGSFGTTAHLRANYYSSGLSLISDFYMNGWSKFAGDYFVKSSQTWEGAIYRSFDERVH
jgi:hypothetical protein